MRSGLAVLAVVAAMMTGGASAQTVILVRHAEKAATPAADPPLTPAGEARAGALAQTLTLQLPEFDFLKQSFNLTAVLGETGAGTALTNVALGIAYAHHFGKPVLVVAPPAVVRPIRPDKPWFRARGGNHAYLPWWGLRHDAPEYYQGFSQ